MIEDPGALAAPQQTEFARSYYLTRWSFVNDSLAYADRVTNGRAGWVQRFVTYFFAGGFAAVVNLICYFLFFHVLFKGFDDHVTSQLWLHKAIAWIPATEISIFANFIPNDYLTFRRLPGHNRHWTVRAARFHLTCLGGVALTALIFATLSVFMPSLLAQTIALALVFLFNFTFHHIYTYRHK